jgi:hypothetical protein
LPENPNSFSIPPTPIILGGVVSFIDDCDIAVTLDTCARALESPNPLKRVHKWLRLVSPKYPVYSKRPEIFPEFTEIAEMSERDSGQRKLDKRTVYFVNPVNYSDYLKQAEISQQRAEALKDANKPLGGLKKPHIDVALWKMFSTKMNYTTGQLFQSIAITPEELVHFIPQKHAERAGVTKFQGKARRDESKLVRRWLRKCTQYHVVDSQDTAQLIIPNNFNLRSETNVSRFKYSRISENSRNAGFTEPVSGCLDIVFELNVSAEYPNSAVYFLLQLIDDYEAIFWYIDSGRAGAGGDRLAYEQMQTILFNLKYICITDPGFLGSALKYRTLVYLMPMVFGPFAVKDRNMTTLANALAIRQIRNGYGYFLKEEQLSEYQIILVLELLDIRTPYLDYHQGVFGVFARRHDQAKASMRRAVQMTEMERLNERWTGISVISLPLSGKPKYVCVSPDFPKTKVQPWDMDILNAQHVRKYPIPNLWESIDYGDEIIDEIQIDDDDEPKSPVKSKLENSFYGTPRNSTTSPEHSERDLYENMTHPDAPLPPLWAESYKKLFRSELTKFLARMDEKTPAGKKLRRSVAKGSNKPKNPDDPDSDDSERSGDTATQRQKKEIWQLLKNNHRLRIRCRSKKMDKSRQPDSSKYANYDDMMSELSESEDDDDEEEEEERPVTPITAKDTDKAKSAKSAKSSKKSKKSGKSKKKRRQTFREENESDEDAADEEEEEEPIRKSGKPVPIEKRAGFRTSPKKKEPKDGNSSKVSKKSKSSYSEKDGQKSKKSDKPDKSDKQNPRQLPNQTPESTKQARAKRGSIFKVIKLWKEYLKCANNCVHPELRNEFLDQAQMSWRIYMDEIAGKNLSSNTKKTDSTKKSKSSKKGKTDNANTSKASNDADNDSVTGGWCGRKSQCPECDKISRQAYAHNRIIARDAGKNNEHVFEVFPNFYQGLFVWGNKPAPGESDDAKMPKEAKKSIEAAVILFQRMKNAYIANGSDANDFGRGLWKLWTKKHRHGEFPGVDKYNNWINGPVEPKYLPLDSESSDSSESSASESGSSNSSDEDDDDDDEEDEDEEDEVPQSKKSKNADSKNTDSESDGADEPTNKKKKGKEPAKHKSTAPAPEKKQTAAAANKPESSKTAEPANKKDKRTSYKNKQAQAAKDAKRAKEAADAKNAEKAKKAQEKQKTVEVSDDEEDEEEESDGEHKEKGSSESSDNSDGDENDDVEMADGAKLSDTAKKVNETKDSETKDAGKQGDNKKEDEAAEQTNQDDDDEEDGDEDDGEASGGSNSGWDEQEAPDSSKKKKKTAAAEKLKDPDNSKIGSPKPAKRAADGSETPNKKQRKGTGTSPTGQQKSPNASKSPPIPSKTPPHPAPSPKPQNSGTPPKPPTPASPSKAPNPADSPKKPASPTKKTAE